MNKKKISLVIVSIFILLIIMAIPNKVKAKTTMTSPIYFGINEFRTKSGSGNVNPTGLSYAIGNPYGNRSNYISDTKISKCNFKYRRNTRKLLLY